MLKKTFQWIDKNDMELKNWDKEPKESIVVSVCNDTTIKLNPK